MKIKGKQAVSSRNDWKERAEIAEAKLANSHSQASKFKMVKKQFSKMYHPDSISGDRFEKLIKQEIFKEFWQVIESIEKKHNQFLNTASLKLAGYVHIHSLIKK